MDTRIKSSGGVILVLSVPTMVEAYGWTGITPVQYMDHTPAEIDMMIQVTKIKAGVSEPPAPGQIEHQDDETMETVVSAFLHPVINACHGGGI